MFLSRPVLRLTGNGSRLLIDLWHEVTERTRDGPNALQGAHSAPCHNENPVSRTVPTKSPEYNPFCSVNE